MTLPDWLLERYAVGEVTDEERARAEADPDLPAQLAALRASDDAIRRLHPPVLVGSRIRARRRAATARRWRAPAVGLALAAAGALLLVRAPDDDDGHRARGLAPALEVYRQTAAGAERLGPGAPVRSGDVLQLSVVRGDATHGWIVSVDGGGAVTLHGGGELAPGRTNLPHAYRLDDAPAFERFFLVTDDEPLAREDVVRAARALAAQRDPALPLDVPGAHVVDILVVKP